MTLTEGQQKARHYLSLLIYNLPFGVASVAIALFIIAPIADYMGWLTVNQAVSLFGISGIVAAATICLWLLGRKTPNPTAKNTEADNLRKISQQRKIRENEVERLAEQAKREIISKCRWSAENREGNHCRCEMEFEGSRGGNEDVFHLVTKRTVELLEKENLKIYKSSDCVLHVSW